MTFAPTHREAKASASDAVTTTCDECGLPLVERSDRIEAGLRELSAFRERQAGNPQMPMPRLWEIAFEKGWLAARRYRPPALALAAVPESVRSLADRLRAWSESDPDPGYFFGSSSDVFSAMQLDCADAAKALLATPSSIQAGEQVSAPASAGAVPEGLLVGVEGPIAWVIPGDDNANMNGFLDAMCHREGEFTRPLYALAAAPATPEPAAGGKRSLRVDTQVWTAAANLDSFQKQQPDWLWYSDGGTSFGRWPTSLGQAPYVRADHATLSASTADGETAGDGRENDRLDAARFRALMRCGRIKVQGSAGVDPDTGARKYPDQPGAVHFGAEFWPIGDGEPSRVTVWGQHCLRALADDILDLDRTVPPTPIRTDATAEDATPATPAEGR